MTLAAGPPGHSRIVGTRAPTAVTGTAKRRKGARLAAPQRLRTPGDDMESWIQQGACLTCEPDLFFPITPSGYKRPKKLAEAKAVCHRCPVIDSCRTWALAHPRMSQYGVWGAMSEEERRVARRRGGGTVPGADTLRPTPDRCGTGTHAIGS